MALRSDSSGMYLYMHCRIPVQRQRPETPHLPASISLRRIRQPLNHILPPRHTHDPTAQHKSAQPHYSRIKTTESTVPLTARQGSSVSSASGPDHWSPRCISCASGLDPRDNRLRKRLCDRIGVAPNVRRGRCGGRCGILGRVFRVRPLRVG